MKKKFTSSFRRDTPVNFTSCTTLHAGFTTVMTYFPLILHLLRQKVNFIDFSKIESLLFLQIPYRDPQNCITILVLYIQFHI